MKLNMKIVYKIIGIGLVFVICTDIVLLIIHDHSKIQQINRILSIVASIGLLLFCIQKGITWIISLGFNVVALFYYMFMIYKMIFEKEPYEYSSTAVFFSIAEIFAIIEIIKYLKNNRNNIHF